MTTQLESFYHFYRWVNRNGVLVIGGTDVIVRGRRWYGGCRGIDSRKFRRLARIAHYQMRDHGFLRLIFPSKRWILSLPPRCLQRPEGEMILFKTSFSFRYRSSWHRRLRTTPCNLQEGQNRNWSKTCIGSKGIFLKASWLSVTTWELSLCYSIFVSLIAVVPWLALTTLSDDFIVV